MRTLTQQQGGKMLVNSLEMRKPKAKKAVTPHRRALAHTAANDVAVEIRKVFANERSDSVVAEKTSYAVRGVTAVKNGEHEVSFAKLFAIMSAYPSIAQRIEYWAGRFKQPDTTTKRS
jgi:hypothetical protein